MIIADTSGLLGFFNAKEPAHPRVVEAVAAERDPLVVSPYVVAELDYLVATRVGVQAELTVLSQLASGSYELASVDVGALDAARAVVQRYADQQVSVTDASLVVLADRYATRTILTLDRRHFSVLRPLTGGRFRLLP